LKRRNVFRVSAVYLAVAWLLLQVMDTLGPILDLSVPLQRTVLILLSIGFPIAVISAWALELTPAGLRRDSGSQPAAKQHRRPIDYVIVIVLAAAVAYFVIDKFVVVEQDFNARVEASVAVLPFTNMTKDEGNDPFTDGIHDDLLTHLSRIATLKTTSRTSVLQYRNTTKTIPQIAAELGVATVVEAGIQKSGNRVRINVQLIDAAADEHLWAEQYDRELTAVNVFEIQSEIATAIAGQLKAALTPDERDRLDKVPTQNFAALEAYFVGRKMLEDRTRESLTAAVRYFEKVVALDPEFALGWSGLADAYMLLPEYSSDIDRELVETRSRAAVLNALKLDPDLPEVRATKAWYELRFYDWDTAEQIFRDALGVAPDNTSVLHWLSHVLSWQGQHDEAVAIARRAVAVEPDSRMMRTNLAYILTDARRFDEARQIMHDLRKEDPDYTVMRRNYYLHELRAGQPAMAADAFADYIAIIGGDAEAAREIGDMFVAFVKTGERGRVTDELASQTLLGSEDLAQVLAFVGDTEGTIKALQIAAAENSASRSVFSMKINPAYDFIRDDSRFVALLQEVGLSD
jgi:TolB-like protein/Tfp pilus assembly protein PilF